jgi:MFS family permease
VLRSAQTALSDPTIRRLVGSAAATAAAMEILLLYQVRIMIAVGMAAATASWFAGARGLAQLLGRLPLTRTVARHGVRTTLVAARIGLALGCVSIVWSGHTWATLIYVVVAGATLGALSPLEGIFAATTLPQDDLGSLMGGLALLSGVAGASGPILAAVIVDATHRTADAAILAAVCAVLSVLILPLRVTRAEAQLLP